MLRKSINEGKLPGVFKMAHITPIHKGGSRKKKQGIINQSV